MVSCRLVGHVEERAASTPLASYRNQQRHRFNITWNGLGRNVALLFVLRSNE
jgi:hypothetical protein